MTLIIVLLALWIIGMALVTYLFCAAVREFVSSPEAELLPVSHDRASRLSQQGR